MQYFTSAIVILRTKINHWFLLQELSYYSHTLSDITTALADRSAITM
jgi:hypothetical protein